MHIFLAADSTVAHVTTIWWYCLRQKVLEHLECVHLRFEMGRHGKARTNFCVDRIPTS